MDIRYNFLNTLDHFPCDLIRTLWILQSLDLRKDPAHKDDWLNAQMAAQSQHLNNLVEEQLNALISHRQDLIELIAIRKRYDRMTEKENQIIEKTSESKKKLTIKLNLKHKVNKGNGLSKTKVRNNNAIENEETYCICQKVSYGAMIACDNVKCPVEWFHYGCVGISKPPQGKWYCSESCRKQSQTIRKVKKGKRRRLN